MLYPELSVGPCMDVNSGMCVKICAVFAFPSMSLILIGWLHTAVRNTYPSPGAYTQPSTRNFESTVP